MWIPGDQIHRSPNKKFVGGLKGGLWEPQANKQDPWLLQAMPKGQKNLQEIRQRSQETSDQLRAMWEDSDCGMKRSNFMKPMRFRVFLKSFFKVFLVPVIALQASLIKRMVQPRQGVPKLNAQVNLWCFALAKPRGGPSSLRISRESASLCTKLEDKLVLGCLGRALGG